MGFRLYGVNTIDSFTTEVALPSGEFTDLTIEALFKPSKQLLRDIRYFPKGSHLLIDTVPPEERSEISKFDDEDENMQNVPVMNERYWMPIERICQERGHIISYLKSAEQFSISMRMGNELSCWQDELECLPEDEKIPDEKKIDQANHLNRMIYAAAIKRVYHDTVMVEETAMECIDELQPDAVIMDARFANRLMLRGRQVSAYHREDTPDPALLHALIQSSLAKGMGPIALESFVNHHMIRNKLMRHAEVVPDELDMDKTRMRYNALHTRRLSAMHADFRGYFGTIPEAVIELFFDDSDGSGGDRVSGRMLDIYGAGTFTGRITPASLEITRRIGDKESLFVGERNGQGYTGLYSHPGADGEFVDTFTLRDTGC